MDFLEHIKTKISSFALSDIIFTKKKAMLLWLAERNSSTLEELKVELKNLQYLVLMERQTAEFEGKTEERFRCYFVYSRTKGRCFVIKFNHQLKIVTVFPLGRTTLRKYKRKFK